MVSGQECAYVRVVVSGSVATCRLPEGTGLGQMVLVTSSGVTSVGHPGVNYARPTVLHVLVDGETPADESVNASRCRAAPHAGGGLPTAVRTGTAARWRLVLTGLPAGGLLQPNGRRAHHRGGKELRCNVGRTLLRRVARG
jgi:hypothetical protein